MDDLISETFNPYFHITDPTIFEKFWKITRKNVKNEQVFSACKQQYPTPSLRCS